MLPPSIPTSFVPHTASGASRRSSVTSITAFTIISYAIFGIVFVLALGVFLYGRILASSKANKDSALAEAQASINPAVVESFVRLRNRLSSGETLLNNHTAFSGFFSAFGSLLPTTVRFTSVHLSLDEKGKANFDGAGVSKSFNALAAASTAFAKDGRIKSAIFSNIVVNAKDSSVSFSFSATLDPKLVVYVPSVPAVTLQTSTATSTASTTPSL